MYRACEVYVMDKLPVTDPDHSSPDSIIPTIPERLFAIDPGTY